MATYYITWLSVVILGFVMRAYDHPEKSIKGERIHHPVQTTVAFCVAVSILSFVGGLRYRVGADYMPYYSLHSYYMDVLLQNIKTLSEPGISILYRIATLFYDDPASCIFLCAAVTAVLGLIVVYRHSENLMLGMLLYVFVVWHTCFNGIRQALAVSVLFCGYSSLKERQLLKWCLAVFAAFLFHRSSAVLAIMFFLVHRRIKLTYVIALFVGTFFLLRLYNRLFELIGWLMDKQDYVAYHEEGGSNYISRSVNILRILFEVFPAAFFMFNLGQKERTEEMDFYLNLLLIHAALAITTMGSAYMARMSLYTMPFAIVAICNLMPELGRGKAIWSPAFVCAFAFFGWYEIYNNSSLQPFRWIWER